MFVRCRSGEGVFVSRTSYSTDYAFYKSLLAANYPPSKDILHDYYCVGCLQDVELSFKQQLHRLHRRKGRRSRHTADNQR